VRQGSCLSPAIFNVFINVLILQLKELNIGCRVSGMFVGCLLYADDIILPRLSSVLTSSHPSHQCETREFI